jgi:hypothetical protein
MIHDMRWLLGFAWCCVGASACEFAKSKRWARPWTAAISGLCVSAIPLLWLYVQLTPLDAAPPPSFADVLALLSRVVSRQWFHWAAGGCLGAAFGPLVGVVLRHNRRPSIFNSQILNGADAATLVPNQLYLGRITVSFVTITLERNIELNFTVFNASDMTIYIDGIAGRIIYNGRPNSGTSPISLPAPTFKPEWNREIKPKSEFYIIVDQKIPSDLIELIEKDRQTDTILFSLDEFKLVAYARHDRDITAQIPLWNGFCCLRGEHVAVGRVMSISMGDRLQVRDS